MSDQQDLLEAIKGLTAKIEADREVAKVNREASTDFQIHKPGYKVPPYITELVDRTEEVREINSLIEFTAYRKKDLERTIAEDKVVSESAENMLKLAPSMSAPVTPSLG